LAGTSKKRKELTVASATELYNLDYPSATCQKVLVDDERNTALVCGQGNLIGLVTGLGQNYITREFKPGLVRQFEETRSGIELWLNDFTLKRIKLTINDPEQKSSTVKQLKLMDKHNGPDNS
jgi:hypothetical protein